MNSAIPSSQIAAKLRAGSFQDRVEHYRATHAPKPQPVPASEPRPGG